MQRIHCVNCEKLIQCMKCAQSTKCVFSISDRVFSMQIVFNDNSVHGATSQRLQPGGDSLVLTMPTRGPPAAGEAGEGRRHQSADCSHIGCHIHGSLEESSTLTALLLGHWYSQKMTVEDGGLEVVTVKVQLVTEFSTYNTPGGREPGT